MITPQEIIERARRKYEAFLVAWLRGEVEMFLPLDWPVGRIPGDLASIRNGGMALQESSKERRGYGYSVQWTTRSTQRLGQQTLPDRVVIDTPHDFLKLIGKDREFTLFQADVQAIRSALPALETWLETYPLRIIEYHGKWKSIILVCQYFLSNPKPTRHIRELPIEVDTKFIEQNDSILRSLLDTLLPVEAINSEFTNFERRYGLRFEEPLIRFRLLDDQLEWTFALPLDDLSIPLSQFARLSILKGQRCIIVENKTTFLCLPRFPKTFAIWGKGFDVSTLKNVVWLHTCPILYWGDLDAQGFQILSSLRGIFPTAKTTMMDRATFDAFQQFVVTGKEVRLDALPNLTETENSLCQYLVTNTLRLEQERLPFTFVVQQLKISWQGASAE